MYHSADRPPMVGFREGTYESRPTYQQHAVARYLEENQSTLPPMALFNARGRAIPGKLDRCDWAC